MPPPAEKADADEYDDDDFEFDRHERRGRPAAMEVEDLTRSSAATGRVFDYASSSSSSDDEDDNDGASLRPIKKSSTASRRESIGKPVEVDENVDNRKSSAATRSGAVVASTAAARPEIRKAATSSAAAANNNNGKNSKNSNNSDERWLENFNLLRPCIARDGSVDYSVLDDDDDEGGTLRRRIRNFAKEQRRRYSRLVVDDGDGDGDRDDRGGRSGTADERLRLLTEAGFDFRPSETNKGERAHYSCPSLLPPPLA